jgi:hypothetical protein
MLVIGMLMADILKSCVGSSVEMILLDPADCVIFIARIVVPRGATRRKPVCLFML